MSSSDPLLVQTEQIVEILDYHVEYREADPDDPLGGVIDIITEAGLIQIISYAGRFPRVISDALDHSPVELSPGSPLKIAPLIQLVATKLYAGGIKSKADILELLRANPDADLGAIEDYCHACCLRGFPELRKELEA